MSLPRAGLGVLGVLRLADDGPKGDDRRDCHDPKHIHAPLLHLRHTRPADDRYFDPIAGHLLETCLRAEGAWRRPRMDHASAGRTMYGEICLCSVWCPPHDDVMHPAGPRCAASWAAGSDRVVAGRATDRWFPSPQTGARSCGSPPPARARAAAVPAQGQGRAGGPRTGKTDGSAGSACRRPCASCRAFRRVQRDRSTPPMASAARATVIPASRSASVVMLAGRMDSLSVAPAKA